MPCKLQYCARRTNLKIMEITQEKLKGNEMKLTITLTEKEMGEYEKQALQALQNEVKVDGFRQGNIPADVMKKKIGEQAFMGQVVDMAISATYEKAIQKEGLSPVDYPKLSIVEHSPLKYEATFPVIPEVEWKKDVKKLMVKPEKVKVEKKDIEEVLGNLKKSSMTWADVDRAAKKNDRVEIDFDGFDEKGELLPGTSSKNHPVVIGEGSLIPGFEEEIVGMKKEEEKEFKITFPEDYHKEDFQKKEVKFFIKVNRIEEGSEAKLDDAFAEKITGGNRKTMKELEEEIQDELSKHKSAQEEVRQENEFLKALPDYVKVEIPQAMIDRETDFLIERIKADLQKQRITWEDYQKDLEEKGKNIREELKETAQKQVVIRLALEKLYEEEKVTVEKKEVEAEVEEHMKRYPAEFAPMMKERFQEGGEAWRQLETQVRLRKLVANHVKVS